MRAMPDDPIDGEEFRNNRRTAMFVAANCLTARGRFAVRIRNMSSDGALFEGDALPRPGETFELVRAHLRVTGQAMWTEGNQCGAAFQGPIDVAAWMARQAPGQLKVDALIQQARSDMAAGRPTRAETAAGPALDIAHNVELAIALLERLDGDLSHDPMVVTRHQHQLQALDRAVQLLRSAKAGLTG